MEKGRAEGRLEGRAEGRAEGHVRGKAEGENLLGALDGKALFPGPNGGRETLRHGQRIPQAALQGVQAGLIL